MKIIIAPNTIKESLSTMSVVEVIGKGFREIHPTPTMLKCPWRMVGKEPCKRWWKPVAGVIRAASRLA